MTGPPAETRMPVDLLQEIERRIDSILENEDLSVTGQGLLEHVRDFARQLAATLRHAKGYAEEIERSLYDHEGDAKMCSQHIQREVTAVLEAGA